MKHTKTLYATLAITTAACLLCCTVALAKKGGGGGDSTPAGTVYFYLNSQTTAMNADGSNKTAEAAGVAGVPSHALHAGRRWFLNAAGAPNSTGNGLFASASYTDSNGDPRTDLVPLILPGDDGDWDVGLGNARWVFDFVADLAGLDGTDGMASWLAVRRVDGEIVESAICRAPLLYDSTTGDVTGVDLSAVERFPVASSDFDWSPEGARIAFAYGKVISTYDTVTDELIVLPMSNVVQPAWSPDGSKLAFVVGEQKSDQIKTVELDGLQQTTLTSVTRRSDLGQYLFTPLWSPTGTHLVYFKENWKFGQYAANVWRIGANGKGAKNLTRDLVTSGPPSGDVLGWR